MFVLKVKDIRNQFKHLLNIGKFEENDTIEILNASFVADEASIFGKINQDYIDREIEWYKSQSLNVNDIPPPVPKIWKDVSGYQGEINSNYGWCIYSEANGNQYWHAINALLTSPGSRQATMHYTRPTMHEEAYEEGMTDFMCTYAVQLFIRDNALHYVVYMRSNDAVFGYKNDRAWHGYVFNQAYEELKKKYKDLKHGTLYWNSASLHVYPRHYHLIEEYNND